MEEVEAPVLHEQVLAPDAVKFADDPEQIVALLTATVGTGFAVTVVVLVFVQPKDVPVTVYIVVIAGVTEMAAVVAPVFQL